MSAKRTRVISGLTLDGRERRASHRTAVSDRVVYEVEGETTLAFLADLSMGGMRVRGAPDLTGGREVEFVVHLNDRGAPLRVWGHVVAPASGPANIARVEFLTDQDHVHKRIETYFKGHVMRKLEKACAVPEPESQNIVDLAKLLTQFGELARAHTLYRKARAAIPEDLAVCEHFAAFLIARVLEHGRDAGPLVRELQTVILKGQQLGQSELLDAVAAEVVTLRELLENDTPPDVPTAPAKRDTLIVRERTANKDELVDTVETATASHGATPPSPEQEEARERLVRRERKLDKRRDALAKQAGSLSARAEELDHDAAELEQRGKDLMARRVELEQRELQARRQSQGEEERQQQLEELERELSRREPQLQERERELSKREPQLEERKRELSRREQHLEERERELGEREGGIGEVERKLEARRKQLDTRAQELDTREQQFITSAQQLDSGAQPFGGGKPNGDGLAQEFESRAQEFNTRQEALDAHEIDLRSREQHLGAATHQLAQREEALNSQLAVPPRGADSDSTLLEQRLATLASREEELRRKAKELDKRELSLGTHQEPGAVDGVRIERDRLRGEVAALRDQLQGKGKPSPDALRELESLRMTVADLRSSARATIVAPRRSHLIPFAVGVLLAGGLAFTWALFQPASTTNVITESGVDELNPAVMLAANRAAGPTGTLETLDDNEPPLPDVPASAQQAEQAAPTRAGEDEGDRVGPPGITPDATKKRTRARPKRRRRVTQLTTKTGETSTDGAGTASEHYAQGRTYLRERKALLAVTELEAAIELEPSYAPAYRILGTAYAMLGRRDEAIRVFEEFLRRAPENPNAGAIRQFLLDSYNYNPDN